MENYIPVESDFNSLQHDLMKQSNFKRSLKNAIYVYMTTTTTTTYIIFFPAEIECPVLEPAEDLNGMHIVNISCTNGHYYGSICTYICVDGYNILPGHNPIKLCNEHGTWLGDTPVCLGTSYLFLYLIFTHNLYYLNRFFVRLS